MGLPMFRSPSPTPTPPIAAAAKLDRAAATQRSSIRRQPTIRPGRGQYPSDRDRHREELLARLRNSRPTRRRRLAQDAAQYLLSDDEDFLEMLPQPAAASGLRRDLSLLHALTPRDGHSHASESNGGPDGRVPISSRGTSPFRDSSIEPDHLNTENAPISSAARGVRLLSPPSSSGSGRVHLEPPNLPPSNIRSNIRYDIDVGDPPNLTPGFAPAVGPFRERRMADSPPQRNALETPPPDGIDEVRSTLPPLRRVPRMSPRPLPRSIPDLDGLGDRRRSMSPSRNDEEEESTWTNMMLTLYDASEYAEQRRELWEREHGLSLREALGMGRSSTATSFNSDTGSGSGSGARSRNSQQTTATSFGEITELGQDDACDLDLPEGISQEDVRRLRELHRDTNAGIARIEREQQRRQMQQQRDSIRRQMEAPPPHGIPSGFHREQDNHHVSRRPASQNTRPRIYPPYLDGMMLRAVQLDARSAHFRSLHTESGSDGELEEMGRRLDAAIRRQSGTRRAYEQTRRIFERASTEGRRGDGGIEFREDERTEV